MRVCEAPWVRGASRFVLEAVPSVLLELIDLLRAHRRRPLERLALVGAALRQRKHLKAYLLDGELGEALPKVASLPKLVVPPKKLQGVCNVGLKSHTTLCEIKRDCWAICEKTRVVVVNYG